MTVKLRIICRAVQTRIKMGEGLETILASYPRLTESDKHTIRGAIIAQAKT